MKRHAILLALIILTGQLHCQSWKDYSINSDSLIKAYGVKTQYIFATEKVNLMSGKLDSVPDKLMMKTDSIRKDELLWNLKMIM